MGGDLMAREWDVPGYTGVKVLGSGGFGEVVNMENAFLKKSECVFRESKSLRFSHWRSVRAGGLLACGFCV